MTAEKSKIGFLIPGVIGLVFSLLGLFAEFIKAERVLAETALPWSSVLPARLPACVLPEL